MIFIKLYLFENVRLCDLKLLVDSLNEISSGCDYINVSDFTYVKRFFSGTKNEIENVVKRYDKIVMSYDYLKWGN